MKLFLEREKKKFYKRSKRLKNFNKHDELKWVARQLLKRMGFVFEHIHYEYYVYLSDGCHSRIDVVGISASRRVAIEVGSNYNKDRLQMLREKFGFNEAYFLTYAFKLKE